MSTSVSRKHVLEMAPSSIPVSIGGTGGVANLKEFKTGSIGWHYAGKVDIKIGGEVMKAQVGVTITLIGSKEFEQ